MWLLSPLSWLLLALLSRLALSSPRLRRRPGARALAAICSALVVLALIAMTPLAGNALVALVERPIASHPGCELDPPSNAVVLSGGVDHRPADQDDFGALGVASRRRLERGLAYITPASERMLTLTGGPATPGSAPEAALMRRYAEALGIAPERIHVEPAAATTWDNARAVAEIGVVPKRIALITSAWHLRRARLAFEAAGFEVCMLGADSLRVPIRWPGALLPRGSALRRTEVALHELVGIVYYRWLRWRQQRLE